MASVFGNSGNNTLRGTGASDIVVGYDGNDTLYGEAGDDELHGGIGYTDHLYGGRNNDTYVIRDTQDVVHEAANEGNDTVNAYVSYTLTANVENLNLFAGTTATGNSLDNVITGNAGNNTLIGGFGDDILDGGEGTDTADYSHWDSVAEGQRVVFDLGIVFDGASRQAEARLPSSPGIRSYDYVTVEQDTLRSIENIRGTNSSDLFFGSDANNEFWGRGGNDTFHGDLGRDTYHGDGGTDTVDYSGSAAISIDLTSGGIGGLAEGDRYTGIENATGSNFNDQILGTAADNDLFGKDGKDIIEGRAGDDDIDGGLGIDTMIGGADNDTYRVDSAFDTVIEQSGQGSDVVFSTAYAYTLSNFVEILSLDTSTDTGVYGTGNAQANTIFGNINDNVLEGGGGADTLSGLGGNDTIVFRRGDAHGDSVYEFNGNGAGAGDVLQFAGYGTVAQGATFRQLTATQWEIGSADGSTHDIITLVGSPAVEFSDLVFV